jgi:hypothetical protein
MSQVADRWGYAGIFPSVAGNYRILRGRLTYDNSQRLKAWPTTDVRHDARVGQPGREQQRRTTTAELEHRSRGLTAEVQLLMGIRAA